MPYSVEVRGSNRVRNDLRKFIKQFPKESGDELYQWAQETRAALKSEPYPAPLPHFRHRRTGMLANRWAVERRGGRNSTTVEITNRANRDGFPYPVVVVGNSRGERNGRANHPSFSRWWIARNKIEERTPELVRRLTRLLERLI